MDPRTLTRGSLVFFHREPARFGPEDVVAHLVHQGSPRAGRPFVAINCAALPEQLLESELFGHEKGAFTGALATKVGRIEQAAGGTLFLDEIAEMGPLLQAKLLRVLQEREFQRLGSTRTLRADVRVIAATNRDLAAAIAQGQFREDLYYRLNVFEIRLPPLPPGGVDLDEVERSYVERALDQTRGNRSKAARLLGITRAQLYSRLDKYGLR